MCVLFQSVGCGSTSDLDLFRSAETVPGYRCVAACERWPSAVAAPCVPRWQRLGPDVCILRLVSETRDGQMPVLPLPIPHHLPSCSHRLLLATRENLLEQSRRQFLALHVSAPTAACLAGFDLPAGSGFGVCFSIPQFLQQTRVLDLFLELAHGLFYLTILHYHGPA